VLKLRRDRQIMPLIDPANGPVVVGGVGGSGTRVVAEMMRELGMHTGTDLNKAGDNKWFTLLCKLPRWDLDESSQDASSVKRSLEILERAMTGQMAPERDDRKAIAAAVSRSDAWSRNDPLPDDRPLSWLRDRAASLRRSRRETPSDLSRWGWKEPNSHLFLAHLRTHFGDRLKYVHTIRHGMYMAHSANQSQVRRWGPYFGVFDRSASPDPSASLDYWIEANDLAIARGKALGPKAFLLINYDDLCASPREGAARFVEFLGLDPPPQIFERLVSLPNAPKPTNPTPPALIEQFGGERLARVRAFGFDTDCY
jgi:Sulfotransferase family